MSWIPFIYAIGGLVIGLVVGWLAANKTATSSSIDVELHNTKAEFERYKAEVTEHLQSTSELMHAAQENYDQLTEQLQKTKLLLTDEPAPEPQLVARKPAGELPPRDYANTSHGLLKQKETSE